MITQSNGKRSAILFRAAAAAALIASTGLIAGCKKEPGGQVVAVVNGEEVTLQELNAELANANAPEGADKTALRQLALANIINRRLLGSVAHDQGIDSSPDFIVHKRQAEEALLVQMLGQQVARQIKKPTPQDLDRFIGENPQMFGAREAWLVDQIRFPTPSRQEYIGELSKAKTMAEVVATLNRLGIQFERGNTQFDTAAMPRDLINQIKAVSRTEPYVLPSPAMVSVNLTLATKPMPIGGEQARPIAAEALQRQALGAELDKRIASARAGAEISYQPGYAPPANQQARPGATPGAAAASAAPAAPKAP
jgi:peptidyl-prolyl cis-trans isomerase C